MKGSGHPSNTQCTGHTRPTTPN